MYGVEGEWFWTVVQRGWLMSQWRSRTPPCSF
jgi:hypothetical protein